MALPKQTLNVNFAQGLDTQTDPKQVQPGKFLALSNTVFNKGGLLQKRNGYGALTSLPDDTSSFVTTFNNNLTALGQDLVARNAGTGDWVSKGDIQPMQLSTLPLVRSNTNQTYADCAIAENGLVCTVFTDMTPSGGSAVPVYKYIVADSVTGQTLVGPTTITSSGAVITYAPKVFLLGNYFMILFNGVVGATPHLQYIAVNTSDPTLVGTATDISTQYTAASTGTFDAVVANNALYVAWNGSDVGGAIRYTKINAQLSQSATSTKAPYTATHINICADTSSSNAPIIYVSFYDSVSQNGYIFNFDQNLNSIGGPILFVSATVVNNLAASAQNATVSVFYEVGAVYSYSPNPTTNIIRRADFNQAMSGGSGSQVVRSLGLASKPMILDGIPYFLGIYSSPNQPTYFLMNGTTGAIVAKLAYQNGGSYYVTGLPNLVLEGTSTLRVPYPVKTQVQAVNKTQGVANAGGVYAQTGVNLATFAFGTSSINTAEIGNNLHVAGGFLMAYDGNVPVEQGFHLFPDYVVATTSAGGGSVSAQQYYYVATYEWTDNQGNLFRSAPSIPVTVTATGGSSINTINVPTLRLTAKTANPVKIVVYRWSAAQQIYYQVTSITVPTLNTTASDSVAITDNQADASIIGNNILYTTGGVLENIGAPAMDAVALFKSRLFGINSEDKNLLNYSKQVIQGTPVEMSDLLSLYVSPTTGAQGNTGPMRCIAAMDDKFIIFKATAIYYITGNGPDNTGANNDFGEPTFVTSTVGCINQKSIVFMPNGLMFESDKGIWLLGRDLSTTYIGAPVDGYFEEDSGNLVQSAVNVPGTNEVRFTLSTGVTLYYDYYFQQWGTFSNVPAVSSCIYQGLHTYINDDGEVFQETPDVYLDGSRPVLISFKTGWFNLAGLQGFERAYFFYLLGQYITPHKLNLAIAYDYASTPSQVVTITPDNFNPNYGDGADGNDAYYGSGSPYGGEDSTEQWRIFFDKQKCQSFQITLTEIYDSTYGVAAGAGFTMSGLALVVGQKKGYVPIKASRSAG